MDFMILLIIMIIQFQCVKKALISKHVSTARYVQFTVFVLVL